VLNSSEVEEAVVGHYLIARKDTTRLHTSIANVGAARHEATPTLMGAVRIMAGCIE
jgi:hypothetical protein